MNFDLILSGGGGGSSAGLINLIEKINRKKKNKTYDSVVKLI